MSKTYSELMKAIRSGRFVYTGEVAPLKTPDPDGVVHAAKQLRGYVTACNVTDNPRACSYMCSLAASHLIQRDAGVEAIFQMTVRDRNRIALFSDLLGASALGIRNVLVLSGDHTTLGDSPGAMPVYDLDAAQLLYMVKKAVDEGTDLCGNRIEGSVKLNVGIVGNPGATPPEPELLKIAQKVALGADFMQTQAVFDIERAKAFLREMRKHQLPVLVGIFPCKSYGTATFINEHIPGISVPAPLMDALRATEEIADAAKRSEKIDEINLEYFSALVRELRKTTQASGVHVMTAGYERFVKKLVQALA